MHTQFFKTDTIDAARSETIQRIAAFVKDNPEAKPEELLSKVGRNRFIQIETQKIGSLIMSNVLLNQVVFINKNYNMTKASTT